MQHEAEIHLSLHPSLIGRQCGTSTLSGFDTTDNEFEGSLFVISPIRQHPGSHLTWSDGKNQKCDPPCVFHWLRVWETSGALSAESSNQSHWMWTQSAFTNTSIIPWPWLTCCYCLPFSLPPLWCKKKSFLKHNCTITSLSTNPFPPPTLQVQLKV